MIIVCLYNWVRSYYYNDYSIVVHEIAKYAFAWDRVWDGTIFDKLDGPTWFLLALFWGRLFFYWIRKIVRWVLPICIIASVAMIYVHPSVPTPFGIGRGIQALIFMAVGWTYKRCEIPRWVKIIAIVCWPISMALGNIDMYGYHYNCLPIDILGACGATLIIYHTAKAINKTCAKQFFTWCGRNSLVILCAHSIEYSITLVHVLISKLPYKLPSMVYFGVRHAVTLMGAWIYTRCKTALHICKG